jgi:hypothetical protein
MKLKISLPGSPALQGGELHRILSGLMYGQATDCPYINDSIVKD